MSKTFKPPKAVQEAAQEALKQRELQAPSNRGMLPVGLKRANDLAAGRPISYNTIKRMNQYFIRHEVDKKAKESWNDWGKGRQAWNGWGGDAGWSWVKEIIQQEENARFDERLTYFSEVNQEAREKLPLKFFGDPERRAFPILDQSDVIDAARLISKAKNPKKVKARIKRICQKQGFELPKSWEEEDSPKPKSVKFYDDVMGPHQTLGKVISLSWYSPEILKKVYERGNKAWEAGHIRGISQHHHALNRVKSFTLNGPTSYFNDSDLVPEWIEGLEDEANFNKEDRPNHYEIMRLYQIVERENLDRKVLSRALRLLREVPKLNADKALETAEYEQSIFDEMWDELDDLSYAEEIVNEPPGHSGVMVAFFIPEEIAEQLVLPDGEKIEDLHITLGYLGKKEDFGERRHRLLIAIREFAAMAVPLEAKISGLGFFDNEESKPFYASVDIPGIGELRERLGNFLSSYGLEMANDHGYQPHITLKYGQSVQEFDTKLKLPKESFSLDTLTLAIGGIQYDFPLKEKIKDLVDTAPAYSMYPVQPSVYYTAWERIINPGENAEDIHFKRGRKPRTYTQKVIAHYMRRRKRKTLFSGTGRKGERRPFPVTSREQTLAIAYHNMRNPKMLAKFSMSEAEELALFSEALEELYGPEYFVSPDFLALDEEVTFSDDKYIYKEGPIFKLGNYPDKKFSLNRKEFEEQTVKLFKPVPVDDSHKYESVFKDKLGTLEQIWLDPDGVTVRGRVKVPKVLVELLGEAAFKVSSTFDRLTKRIKGLALVNKPRVESAVVI